MAFLQRSDRLKSLRLDSAIKSIPFPRVFTMTRRLIAGFPSFFRSSWRTWMGADSSDSVVSIGWHRGCGYGDASSLSEVSTKVWNGWNTARVALIKTETVRSHGDEAWTFNRGCGRFDRGWERQEGEFIRSIVEFRIEIWERKHLRALGSREIAFEIRTKEEGGARGSRSIRIGDQVDSRNDRGLVRASTGESSCPIDSP